MYRVRDTDDQIMAGSLPGLRPCFWELSVVSATGTLKGLIFLGTNMKSHKPTHWHHINKIKSSL